jgi:hypothetical protein
MGFVPTSTREHKHSRISFVEVHGDALRLRTRLRTEEL